MYGTLLKSGLRVVSVAAVVRPKIAKRKAVQVPAVRGIAEGTEVGVVWRDNHRAAPVCEQPVELFHGAHHVCHMFDHMNRADLAEGAVGKRQRVSVEIRQHIRARIRIAVNADRARVFIDSAADVQHRKN